MYPAGVPERGYQLSIIRTALLNNTLVCLPTGLGKTLIAAVVMYNFTRWFPEARSCMLTPMCPTFSSWRLGCNVNLVLAKSLWFSCCTCLLWCAQFQRCLQ